MLKLKPTLTKSPRLALLDATQTHLGPRRPSLKPSMLIKSNDFFQIQWMEKELLDAKLLPRNGGSASETQSQQHTYARLSFSAPQIQRCGSSWLCFICFSIKSKKSDILSNGPLICISTWGLSVNILRPSTSPVCHICNCQPSFTKVFSWTNQGEILNSTSN